MDAVYRLTHDVYLSKGYCEPQPSGRLIHYPHLDNIADTTVLVALSGSVIVGTNSWTRDGPHGLHVDRDFQPEANAVREEGVVLGSSWRIVTSLESHKRIAVVLALIGSTLHGMVSSGIETSLFTFNPRHAAAYTKMLNMRVIAVRENIGSLKNAPAVLMRLDWQDIPDKWMP